GKTRLELDAEGEGDATLPSRGGWRANANASSTAGAPAGLCVGMSVHVGVPGGDGIMLIISCSMPWYSAALSYVPASAVFFIPSTSDATVTFSLANTAGNISFTIASRASSSE